MSLQIPEPIARALAKAGPELLADAVKLLEQAFTSPDPKAALARALQVTAHERAADAAADALFEAKKHVPGSGV